MSTGAPPTLRDLTTGSRLVDATPSMRRSTVLVRATAMVEELHALYLAWLGEFTGRCFDATARAVWHELLRAAASARTAVRRRPRTVTDVSGA